MDHLLFNGTGIIDVTNDNAMSPEDELGYLSVCIVSVYSDKIVVTDIDNREDIMEIIPASSIHESLVLDSSFGPRIFVTTIEKTFSFSFDTSETSEAFWNAVCIIQNFMK